MGSMKYLAPEYANLNLNFNAPKHHKPGDIWAIGVILYYLLFNKYPFVNYKTLAKTRKKILIKNNQAPFIVAIIQFILNEKNPK